MNITEQKYLIISCFQKAIRRGLTDLALKYADVLYEKEYNYLIYRLSIIAVEDIGIANIDVVHDLMSTEIKKKNILDNGGKNYVLSIIEKLSNGKKDRTACDLMTLAFHNKNHSQLPKEENFYLDPNNNIIDRLSVGWEILGNKKQKNPQFLDKEDNLNLFIELNKKLNVEQKIIDLIKFGYNIHREPHFLSLGLLSSQYQEEAKFDSNVGNVGTPNNNNELYNDFWLIEAIDWHTREGKTAVYNFLKDNSATKKLLQKNVPYQNIAETLGSLLFRLQGQNVDKRLYYPTAVNIFNKASKDHLYLLPNEIKKEVIVTFKEDLPILKKHITTQLNNISLKSTQMPKI